MTPQEIEALQTLTAKQNDAIQQLIANLGDGLAELGLFEPGSSAHEHFETAVAHLLDVGWQNPFGDEWHHAA